MIKKKTFLRFGIFCFVGGIATLIDWAFFNLFSLLLGKELIMLQISRILAIVLSMVWNFFANRKFTFKASQEKVLHQLPKWLIVYGLTSLVNFLVFTLLISILGGEFWPRNIAFVCGTGISLILNFIGSALWAFKKNRKKDKWA